MLNTRAIRGWRQMLANQGLSSTLKTAAARLRTKASKLAGSRKQSGHAVETGSVIHPFDGEHGVDTSGLIWGEHLRGGSRNDAWSTAYYGIAPSIFRRVVGELGIEYPAFAFVDMGSGKGRGLMLALEYGFREIVGVELAPELHAIAQQNLRVFTGSSAAAQRSQVTLLNRDAVELELPAGPVVLFFYHPFCRPVLERVLRNVRASLKASPRELYLIYVNPESKPVLDAAPFLEKIRDEAVAMSPEDRLADRVGSSVEECAVYRARR